LVIPDVEALMNEQRHTHEIIIVVAGLLLLVALGFTVNAIITPFVVTGALLFFLYPFRQSPIVFRLMVLAGLLFAVWFLYSLLGLLAPFIIAFLIAYIFSPLVVRLEQRGWPRWLSSLLAVVLLVGIGISVGLFVLPVAIQQFEGIIAGLAQIAETTADFVQSGRVFEVLARFGIPAEKARELIATELSPRLQEILSTLFMSLFGFVSGFSAVLLQLINIVLIPFLVFYILKDFSSITQRAVRFIPLQHRDRFVGLIRSADVILERYFRGAIIVAALQGIISGVVLWLLGVQYALILGIMTGVLNFIPYVGLLTSLCVASIVALFSGDPVLTKVIGVVVLYLGQKLLEATVLGPKIVGKQVGLHPVLLILCLLVFGYFMGFVGMLIAVPVTAIIMSALNEWEEARTASIPAEVAH
jgi:predicted PurR-regulated permease PerM